MAVPLDELEAAPMYLLSMAMMNDRARTAVLASLVAVCWTGQAIAGPPYNTDDPEPVEFRHWEFYLASQHSHARDGWSGTSPHFEVNYGVIPNVQLHLIAPLSYASPNDGRAAYGYGDTELGIKYRFIQERRWVPQIGTFPFLEVPTGSRRLGLGNGTAQVMFPIWLQKSIGHLTTYGGAGLWVDAGRTSRHWWYLGWLVQWRLFEAVSLGTEIFHQTVREAGTERDTRFNVGGVVDISDEHHVLLSAGRGFTGPNLFQGYIAYQVTLGPRD